MNFKTLLQWAIKNKLNQNLIFISLFGLIVTLIPFTLLTYDCRAETTNSISTPTNSVELPSPKTEEDQQILPLLPRNDPNSVIPQSSSVEGQNNLSASSFAESLNKFQSIQKVLSQNSIRSPRNNPSVLKSLSVEPEAVITIKTESPSTSSLANEIILKPNADLDQKNDSSSSSQVSAAIALFIKKNHKNWQLISRDGRLILTQVEHSQSENPQILSSDSEVTPTPHSSVEIAAAIELFIKKNHNNWQLIPHEGSFILSQLKTPNDIDLQSSTTEIAESQPSDPNLVIPQSSPSSPSPQTSPHPPPSSPVPPSPSPSVSPSPSPSVSPSPQPSPTNTENGENADQIFERVFKRPRLKGGERLIAPLFINDVEQGQIAVVIAASGDNDLQMPASILLKKLSESLVPELQTQLETLVDKNGSLTLATLKSIGLKATFNERSLQVKIEVPPNLRKTLVYGSKNARVPKEAANALRPSEFSGFINLLGYEGYGWNGSDSTLGRQPFNLGIQAAINYQGWVLEGSGSFLENNNNNNPWSRSDIRLVKDDPDNAIRYILGDLFASTRGYQSFVPMVGFGMARNFSLQPYLFTLPTGQFNFFLENPSKVEIYVNDVLNQTLQLPAGPQDIRDFYLNAGTNNIRMKITDNVGQTRELSFASPLAYDLLEEGLDQFAFTIGVPSYNQNSTISYDTSRPMVAGFYRQGITKTLTLGGYLQLAGSQQVIGTEGTVATDWGNVGWDAAIANSPFGFDHAFRLSYQYLAFGGSQTYLPNFGVGIQYLGPYFQSFGNFRVGNPFGVFNYATNNVAWDLGVNYYQTLFNGFGINSSLGYQIGSFDRPNGYRAAIGFTTYLGNGLQINLTVNNRQDQSGNRETQLLFNFLQISQYQSITARSDLSSQREAGSEITWNSNRLSQYNTINTTIGVRNNPNPGYTGARLGLDYRGFVANVALNHDYDQSGQSTNLAFGTALVYADGHFGWTRPVTDSFVIVARNQQFANQLIGINPSPYGYTAEANLLGPAVVPDLNSYTVSTIRVEAPNMPLGYNLGKTVYSFLPSYKSGTLITVGTDSTIFLRGILQNAKGEPISQQAGQLTSLSDPNWESVTIFTNKTGKFASLGLRPGRYELKLFSDPPQSAQFEIPADQKGIYELGNLTLK